MPTEKKRTRLLPPAGPPTPVSLTLAIVRFAPVLFVFFSWMSGWFMRLNWVQSVAGAGATGDGLDGRPLMND